MPVAFTYDGESPGGVLVATITGAVPGVQYEMSSDDNDSASVTDTATGTTLVLTSPDIGDPQLAFTFSTHVWRTDTGEEIGVDIHQIGSTDSYPYEATWTYNGVDTITVTLFADVGVRYRLRVFDDSGFGLVFANGSGSGEQITISVVQSVPFGGGFIGVVHDRDTGANYTSRLFRQGVSGQGSLGNPSPALIVPGPCSLSWRFIVADLDGSTLTVLDHLASERTVTPLLNEPLQVTGTVPSDNPEINIMHSDGLPFLAEGVRQLYCFRRESDVAPYYTIRASTLIMQINDASRTDDARSRFTAWDPWQYLFSRPVLQSSLAQVIDVNGGATTGVDGELIPAQRLLYPATMRADEIVQDILATTIAAADVTAPVAAVSCFIDRTSGTIENCAMFTPEGFPIQQGTSVGQALKDLCDTGYLDIVLSPIYDPANRPGILCELNVYSQTVVNGVITKLGAGSYNYAAQFAWDRPGRSLVGFDNLYDGIGRANHIQYYTGQGGPPITPANDAASIVLYGEYWAQTQAFFPAKSDADIISVEAVAAMQLALRKTFKETLTVNPAPERSPSPFTDYDLGDGVPVYIGRPQQGTYVLGDASSRQTLPPGYSGVPPSPNPLTQVWQRIYGIPVEIDDNGVETVRELIVGPVGAPPGVGGAAAFGAISTTGVAVGAEGRAHTKKTVVRRTNPARGVLLP